MGRSNQLKRRKGCFCVGVMACAHLPNSTQVKFFETVRFKVMSGRVGTVLVG